MFQYGLYKAPTLSAYSKPGHLIRAGERNAGRALNAMLHFIIEIIKKEEIPCKQQGVAQPTSQNSLHVSPIHHFRNTRSRKTHITLLKKNKRQQRTNYYTSFSSF